jgi:hypothetical protein
LQGAADAQSQLLAALQGEEKVLDRSFRKEFADAEAALPRLQQLYKARLAAPGAAEAGAGALAAALAQKTGAAEAGKQTSGAAGKGDSSKEGDLGRPLGPLPLVLAPLLDKDQPLDVDGGVWVRFGEYRRVRGELELRVREENARVSVVTMGGRMGKVDGQVGGWWVDGWMDGECAGERVCARG